MTRYCYVMIFFVSSLCAMQQADIERCITNQTTMAELLFTKIDNFCELRKVILTTKVKTGYDHNIKCYLDRDQKIMGLGVRSFPKKRNVGTDKFTLIKILMREETLPLSTIPVPRAKL